MQAAQKRTFIGFASPAVKHGDSASIAQNEGGYINRIAKGMLGKLAAAAAIYVAAIKGSHRLNPDNFAFEIKLGCRADRMFCPSREVRGQRTGHWPQIGGFGGKGHQLDRVDRAASARKILVGQGREPHFCGFQRCKALTRCVCSERIIVAADCFAIRTTAACGDQKSKQKDGDAAGHGQKHALFLVNIW